MTEETRERLRAQANQLSEPTVIRLLDLLAVAVDDMRQGGDPRLPLELALVKVTRPAADLSREAVAYRLEQLEQRSGPAAPRAAAGCRLPAERAAPQRSVAEQAAPTPAAGRRRASSRPPAVELEQLQEAWQRTIVPAVAEKSIPISTVLGEARPGAARGRHAHGRVPGECVVPPAARRGAEERDAARRRAVRGDGPAARARVRRRRGRRPRGRAVELEGPAGEERILELMKETSTRASERSRA